MIYVGKYISTHGLKGEIKIKSDFSRKDLVFVPNNIIYIKSTPYKILTHRVHKTYNMVTLEGINDIKEIIDLRGNNVYVDKIDTPYLVEDFVNYSVNINNIKCKVKEIIENKKYKILVLEDNKMIPLIDEFILNIDNINKIIYIREE